jgi:hypothetical protein
VIQLAGSCRTVAPRGQPVTELAEGFAHVVTSWVVVGLVGPVAQREGGVRRVAGSITASSGGIGRLCRTRTVDERGSTNG